MNRRLAAAVLAVAAIALAGCAPQLSARDADALAQLADVAPRTSTIDPTLADWTECWLPSEHLLAEADAGDDTTWRVLCRIHWHETSGEVRYQDTTCIGDYARDPMLDHCYRWAHYDYEPRFEDHPGVRAG